MATKLNLESLKALNFKNYGTFLKYELFDLIFEVAKKHAHVAPIPERSIKIYSIHGDQDALLKSNDKLKMLAELFQCGTKPLDALIFIRVAEHALDDPMLNCFTHHKIAPIEDNQFDAVRVLAASVIVFISRGAFPTNDGDRGKNPLPKMVKSMITDADNLKTEADLLDRLCSFDVKHVNTKNIFKKHALIGWDPIMVNRLNLGVAGHKPLKLAFDFAEMMEKPDGSYVKLLIDLYTGANGGFYPRLHPSDASFSNEYKGFYVQSLAAVYDALKMDPKEKILRLSRHPAFLNERAFGLIPGTQTAVIELEPRSYRAWNLQDLKVKIGDHVKFEAGDYEASPVVKVEGSTKKEKTEIVASTSKGEKKTGKVTDL